MLDPDVVPVEGVMCVGDIAGRETSRGAGLRCSSTRTPLSTARPAASANPQRERHADPDDTKSASTRRRRWSDPLDRVLALETLDSGLGQELDP